MRRTRKIIFKYVIIKDKGSKQGEKFRVIKFYSQTLNHLLNNIVERNNKKILFKVDIFFLLFTLLFYNTTMVSTNHNVLV